MKRMKYLLSLAAMAMLTLTMTIQAQQVSVSRVNDKQVKHILDRLERGADSLRESVDDALDRSRFEDTRAGDKLKQHVKDFESATDQLKDRFNKRNTATSDVEAVLKHAALIDTFMMHHQLSRNTDNDWLYLRRNLTELARAYNISWSWSGVSNQPYRITEERMKYVMESIEKGADKFRDSLKDALGKTRFDDTKAEDKINDFVKSFEIATDRLEDRFDDNHSAVGAASEVLRRAMRIDNFMRRHQLTSEAQTDWTNLRHRLEELASAYQVKVDWPGLVIILQ